MLFKDFQNQVAKTNPIPKEKRFDRDMAALMAHMGNMLVTLNSDLAMPPTREDVEFGLRDFAPSVVYLVASLCNEYNVDLGTECFNIITDMRMGMEDDKDENEQGVLPFPTTDQTGNA